MADVGADVAAIAAQPSPLVGEIGPEHREGPGAGATFAVRADRSPVLARLRHKARRKTRVNALLEDALSHKRRREERMPPCPV